MTSCYPPTVSFIDHLRSSSILWATVNLSLLTQKKEVEMKGSGGEVYDMSVKY